MKVVASIAEQFVADAIAIRHHLYQIPELTMCN